MLRDLTFLKAAVIGYEAQIAQLEIKRDSVKEELRRVLGEKPKENKKIALKEKEKQKEKVIRAAAAPAGKTKAKTKAKAKDKSTTKARVKSEVSKSPRAKRELSEEAKDKIAAAQIKRWKEYRKEKKARKAAGETRAVAGARKPKRETVVVAATAAADVPVHSVAPTEFTDPAIVEIAEISSATTMAETPESTSGE